MNQILKRETELLKRSCHQDSRKPLSQYLTRNVEDPRVNLNSILARHFLLSELSASNIRLKRKEMIFGIRMTQIMLDLKDQNPGDTFQGALNIFQRKWRAELSSQTVPKISVLEPACGEGNDYRFMDSFGIAPFLDYTGLDICSSRVSRAREIHPSVNFQTGNVLEMQYEDNSFDYCVVHDLFEHLSPEAISAAISEICRVTRKKIFTGCFNMRPSGDHEIKRVYDYHYNLLGSDKLCDEFRKHGGRPLFRGLNDLVTQRYKSSPHYNRGAYYGIILL